MGPFAGFEEAVPCYENLPAGSFIDVDIADYHARYAADTAVISWRWMRPKPPSAEAAADPLANPVPSALVEYVSHLSERDSMKYLWLDWSCAPQYPKDLAATVIAPPPPPPSFLPPLSCRRVTLVGSASIPTTGLDRGVGVVTVAAR